MRRAITYLLSALMALQPIALSADCGQFFCRNVVRQKVVSRNVVAVPVQQVYTPVYYGVGYPLQQQAADRKQLESIVTAAVEAALGAKQQQQQQQAVAQPQAYSAIAQHCGACHGPSPKNGASIVLTQGNLRCDTITAALRKIRDGEMPKNKTLTPEQMGAIMEELLDAEASGTGGLPPPQPTPQRRDAPYMFRY